MTDNVWIKVVARGQDPNELLRDTMGPRYTLSVLQSHSHVLIPSAHVVLVLNVRGAFRICIGCLLVCRYFGGGSIAKRGISQ